MTDFPSNPTYKVTSKIDVNDHMGLIYKLAIKSSVRWGGKSEDYLGEIYLLVKACAEKYDPSKARFSTYCYRHVYWKIKESVLAQAGQKRLPRKTSDGTYYQKLPVEDLYRFVLQREQDRLTPPLDLHIDNKWLTPQEHHLLRLRLSGASLKVISDETGVTRQAINLRLKTIHKKLLLRLSEDQTSKDLQSSPLPRSQTKALSRADDEPCSPSV